MTSAPERERADLLPRVSTFELTNVLVSCEMHDHIMSLVNSKRNPRTKARGFIQE